MIPRFKLKYPENIGVSSISGNTLKKMKCGYILEFP